MDYNFNNLKILIVDDEDLIREILSEAFVLFGAQVDSADSGNEALKKIQAQKYDLILTDIRMPNGDGIFLLESIKNLPGPKPMLFVCSAYNDLSDEKIIDLGIIQIFTKPFELNALLAAVAKYSAKPVN